jgi:hypothetical protein
MPRNGRIVLVGKREAREVQERADELRELERALRRERHEWRVAEGNEPGEQFRAVR